MPFFDKRSVAHFVPLLTITPNARGSDREEWKGKIFWALLGSDKIAQANQDGSP